MPSNTAVDTENAPEGKAADIEMHILALLQRVSRNKTAPLTRATPADEAAVDSIDIVNILFTLEEAYGVEIDLSAQTHFHTVGDLVDALMAFLPTAET